MKFKKLFILLIATLSVTSCGKKKKDPLVIPEVDVLNIELKLPSKPQYNTGLVRSDDNYDYIDLYELSDFHGAVNFEERGYSDYNGVSKLSDYFAKKRTLNPGGTILLSSGDMFQGTVESNLTKGYAVNYSMNYMGFDCMAVGNHEFDWGTDWLKNNAQLSYENSSIPFLGANIIDKNTNQIPDYLKKSVILNRGEYKIGIIGTIGSLLAPTIYEPIIKNFKFESEKPIVEAEAASLRLAGCNAVVWATHNSFEYVPEVEGVDLIFGGHKHENISDKIGEIPFVATNDYGRSVAHAELKIDKTSKKVTCEKYGIVSDLASDVDDLKNNSDIDSILNQYNVEIDKIKQIHLATSNGPLLRENELKCICGSAFYEAGVEYLKKNKISKDLLIAAFQNQGGIRSDITSKDITYGNVFTTFPFDNELVLIKIKGLAFKNNIQKLSTFVAYRSFTKNEEIDTKKEYYIISSNFVALSSNFIKGVLPTLTENDLINIGKIDRNTIAEFIYNEDPVDIEKFDKSNMCYRPFDII